MPVRFWEPGKAFLAAEDEVMGTIRDVLARGDLVMRQQMLDFEANLAAFVGTSDAVGVGNCTDGIRLILEALGIGPGDEVVTVSHTFLATLGFDDVVLEDVEVPAAVGSGRPRHLADSVQRFVVEPRQPAPLLDPARHLSQLQVEDCRLHVVQPAVPAPA